MITVFGFELFPALFALGAITGATYGILAVGLVLVYRSNRVINFAHGEIGAFGAAICGLLVVRWSVPYWIAFLAALGASATIGGISEIAVVRRLRNAPKLMSLVATLGIAQFLLGASFALTSEVSAGSAFPQPAGLPEFNIGVLRVTGAHSGMLFLSPVAVAGLVAFLRYTRYGMAIRGAAANPERARMVGIFATRMSTLAWVIAGAVAAFTAILIIPTRGFLTVEFLGPGLLLRAVVAAVIARMVSLPVAFAAGFVEGIVEQIVLWRYPSGGLVDMVLFVLILGVLLFRSRPSLREEQRQAWSAVMPWPKLPERLRQIWTVRNMGLIAAVAGFAIALLVSAFVTNTAAITLAAIVAFALVGLSVGVVTGLGGQLSLGQFALAGVGAVASFYVTRHLGVFALGLVAAALTAALLSLIIGLPALRIRGLLLGVTTLAFALAAQSWVFQQPWALGEGVEPGRPAISSFHFVTGKRYLLFSLAILAVGLWIARNVWRGGVGLRLRAVRDNEDAARAFSVSPTRTKLEGFVAAGILAGLGGAIYGHLLSRVTATTFTVVTSINAVALTVLGGIGIIAGPILGALYIVGLPRFLPLDSAGLAATALGWLLLILYFPGGIAQLVRAPRELLVTWLVRQSGAGLQSGEPESEEPPIPVATELALVRPSPERGRRDVPATDHVLLETSSVTKRFGGVQAVDGVDLTVRTGEILGLIGSNGAGKTTLFDVLSGFLKPDEGSIFFAETDITATPPESRARLGIIRSFQDAWLFPTMTALEVVEVALERTHPTNFLVSVSGYQRSERRKANRARELVSLLGLDDYRNKQIGELSTGTRRICDLACLVALEPKLLLLDEPSSGIAQRESEALGELLLRLKAFLDTTMVVIEHDIPLVMSISDRIVAMDSGRVIAEGPPEAVRADAAVVTAYLGRDLRAIERSGVLSAAADAGVNGGRCTAQTQQGSRCTRAAGAEGLCKQHRPVVGAAR